MALWNKKSTDKTAKVAQTSLAELRQELQDMDIQLITYNHHRNAILEKIAYFENQLAPHCGYSLPWDSDCMHKAKPCI